MFSSRDHGFLFINAYPGRSFSKSYESLVENFRLIEEAGRRCIERSAHGIVVVNPITKRFKSRVMPHLDFVDERVDSCLGYFEAKARSEAQLVLRRDNCSYEEWGVGGIRERLVKLAGKHTVWQFETLLDQASHLDCLSWLVGETRELFFLTRLWDGIDDLLARLNCETP
jgi:hypothetical protein